MTGGAPPGRGCFDVPGAKRCALCVVRCASGVGRRASGVGRRASGVGRQASGVRRQASGVRRQASGVRQHRSRCAETQAAKKRTAHAVRFLSRVARGDRPAAPTNAHRHGRPPRHVTCSRNRP
ncbi:hypothetical protein FG484_01110 [Burkholderia pseudomallei]|nr:hypothetical protein [Burkholderia pseudomallei]